ncbi:MAG TPA: hypothetical protein VNL69_02095, partial [Bacteroidota bacterium]|nr:hypothetical protein [Bacteroidota bacterium]
MAYHGIVAGLIVVGFYLLSAPVKSLLSWLGHRLFAKTETKLDDMILEVVRKSVRSLLVVVGLHVAVRELRKGIAADQLTAHQILDYAEALLYIAVVLVLLKIVLGIVHVFINWYLDRLGDGSGSQLRLTLGPLTNKIINLVIGLVAVIIILD